jgi:hypothetical protein
MQALVPVSIGWRRLRNTLDKLVSAVNARSPIQGTGILLREFGSGVLIEADTKTIQDMIDVSIAAAVAASAAAGGGGGATGVPGIGGGGSSGGGTGGTGGTGGGTGGGPDQGGSGGGSGWSYNTPIAIGAGISIYPNQNDLSNNITDIVITRINAATLTADGVGITASGVVTGIFPDRGLANYYYTITYHYNDGSVVTGPVSPSFATSSGNIVLGGQAFAVP